MLIIALILYGLLSGYQQGMIMIMFDDENFVLNHPQGCRGHRYFQYYHIIDIICLSLLLSVGYILKSTHNNYLSVAGALLLTWQFREMFYNFARYNRFIEEEHLVFLDIWHRYLSIKVTALIYIARFVIGAGLIITGALL